MTAVKWAGKSRDKIEGLLAPFGGPDFLAGKDFQGEYFSPNTDFALEWFGDWQRPLLYNHGLDSTLKTSVVGRIKVAPTDKGLWMQAQLDKAHEYYEEIAGLVDKGALGLSSGSVSHLVHVDGKSGEIKSWPLIEGSTTPTPANPDAGPVTYSMKSADAVAHLAIIGTEAPDAIKVDELPPDDPPEPDEAIKAGRVLSKTNEADIRAAFAALSAVISRAFPESEDDEDEPAEDEAKSLKSALTPQALHDAAVASGAACKSGETHEPEPAPLLAVAGKNAETAPDAVDLEALRERLAAKAVAVAKDLLG